jgi:hypothetical protein
MKYRFEVIKLILFFIIDISRNSSVTKVTDYGLDRRQGPPLPYQSWRPARLLYNTGCETAITWSWLHNPSWFRGPECLPYLHVFVTRCSVLWQVWYSGIAQSLSDWLRAGLPKGRSSGRGRNKIQVFFLSTFSRPVLGSTQPSIQ